MQAPYKLHLSKTKLSYAPCKLAPPPVSQSPKIIQLFLKTYCVSGIYSYFSIDSTSTEVIFCPAHYTGILTSETSCFFNLLLPLVLILSLKVQPRLWSSFPHKSISSKHPKYQFRNSIQWFNPVLPVVFPTICLQECQSCPATPGPHTLSCFSPQ